MKLFKKALIVCLMIASLVGLGAFMPTQTALAANNPTCAGSFLGFPVWYRGLTIGASCEIASPESVGGIQKYITIIAANVIEIIFMLTAYVSVVFIIIGGARYIISAGEAEGVKNAKKTITNAVIGLILSIIAVAVIDFIFKGLMG